MVVFGEHRRRRQPAVVTGYFLVVLGLTTVFTGNFTVVLVVAERQRVCAFA